MTGYVSTLMIAYDHLLHKAREHTAYIQLTINHYVNEAYSAYRKNLQPYLGSTDCPPFISEAEMALLVKPHLRSVSLIHDNYFVCSTIDHLESVEYNPDTNYQPHTQFIYIPANEQRATPPVVIVEIAKNRNAIAFGIDPKHLQTLLPRQHSYYQNIIRIGDYILSKQYVYPIDQLADHNYTIHKGDYADIYYHIDIPEFIGYVLTQYLGYFIIWTLLSLISSLSLYYVINRFDWKTLHIKQGLKHNQFEPYFQPIFDSNHQLTGCEILARWVHPQRGVIMPSSFIESAENSGQINAIFSSLIDKVIKSLCHIEHFPTSFHIGFNVCAHQLLDRQLIQDCERFIAAFSSRNCQLSIELTERIKVPTDEAHLSTLEQLSKLGVQTALDDFGTGHNSLIYMNRMKIDYLKIDKAYVDNIEHPSSQHLLDNIIDLANRFSIPTVAEGIERLEQIQYLSRKGVHNFQGFLFEKPISSDVFVKKYLS